MPHYSEQPASGASWQRAYKVTIDNGLHTIPVVTFYEAEVVSTELGTLSQHKGHLSESFSDPTVAFPLLNVETGEETGMATYQDIYVILYSLYRYLAKRRDTPPEEVV